MAIFSDISVINGYSYIIYRLVLECEGVVKQEIELSFDTEGKEDKLSLPSPRSPLPPLSPPLFPRLHNANLCTVSFAIVLENVPSVDVIIGQPFSYPTLQVLIAFLFIYNNPLLGKLN